MMHLDGRSVVAVVEIAVYAPILIISIRISFHHDFTRKAGWIMLALLSLMRIIGAVGHILANKSPISVSYRILYAIMELASASPLLLAVLASLGTVSQHSINRTTETTRIFLKSWASACVGNLIMAIVGCATAGLGNHTPSSNTLRRKYYYNADTLRQTSATAFAAIYLGIVFATFFCWRRRENILRYRRKLLDAVIAALPFICVRIVYGILSAFAPFPVTLQNGHLVPTDPIGSSGLGMFSPASSQWWTYLVLSLIMEYIAVLIYVVVSITTPLDRDKPDSEYDKPDLDTAKSDDSVAINQLDAYLQPVATR